MKLKTLAKTVLIVGALVGIPSSFYFGIKKLNEYTKRGQQEVANFADLTKKEVVIRDANSNEERFFRQDNGIYRDILFKKGIYLEDANKDSIDDLVLKYKSLGLTGTIFYYGQEDGSYKNVPQIRAELERKHESLREKMEEESREIERIYSVK